MEIIKSKILSGYKNIVHGISTKPGGKPPFYNNLSKHVGDDEFSVMQNRERFFGTLKIDQARLVHASQFHSANIKIVRLPGLYKETDGFITAEANLFLVISVADCLPVMIYDIKNKIIANVHAGRRGTQNKIVSKAVDIFTREFNSKPEDLRVFLGPCISKENYEVGEDAAELFDPEFIETRSGKYYADISGSNMAQLKQCGVNETQIETCGLCTYEAAHLHSYRRDKESSGRMFAVIGMKQAGSNTVQPPV